MKSKPGAPESGVDQIRRALANPGSVLLEDTTAPGSGNHLLFTRPKRILSCVQASDVEAFMEDVDAAIAGGGWVAGYLAYEAGYGFEYEAFSAYAAEAASDYPMAWMGVYDAPEKVDPGILDEALCVPVDESDRCVWDGFSIDPLASEAMDSFQMMESEEEYLECVRRVRSLIREGDVYQINYTSRFVRPAVGSPTTLYAAIRRRQPVSWSALVNTEDISILSASPEQFFVRNGTRISVRPMKGTIGRGATPEVDSMLAEWLHLDEKNRAENLMIVDLLRNDLSRICVPGSVSVSDLFRVETYPDLHQMTSLVEGRLLEGCRYGDVFRALFPCGSITGAPKIRAMKRIAELESTLRGIYCGTIGYATPDGRAAFNVAIRTVTWRNRVQTLGAGGGIVWDSDPGEEYRECLLKTRFAGETIPFTGKTEFNRATDANPHLTHALTGAISGITPSDAAVCSASAPSAPSAPSEPIRILETMRCRNGIEWIDRHLERLSATAHRSGFPCDCAVIRCAIDKLVGRLPENQLHRIRLLLDESGDYQLQVNQIEEKGKGPVLLGLATQRVHSRDRFLQIKTTHRRTHQRALDEARRNGFDDSILLNEYGEITEGCISNIFVRHGESWFTPPVECGLLLGIARRDALESRAGIIERRLYLSDLTDADEIAVTNAVRGWRRAVLVPRGVGTMRTSVPRY